MDRPQDRIYDRLRTIQSWATMTDTFPRASKEYILRLADRCIADLQDLTEVSVDKR